MIWLVGLIVFLAGALGAAFVATAAGRRRQPDGTAASPPPDPGAPGRLGQLLDPIVRNRGDAVHSEAESLIHQPQLTSAATAGQVEPAGETPRPTQGEEGRPSGSPSADRTA